MKILVTGARGLLGLNVALQACRANHVIGVDRGAMTSTPFLTIQTDLTSPGAIDHVLNMTTPDAVIHCAAAADVDFCEANPRAALALNADLPWQIAAACGKRNIQLLHVSTDAVFDGAKAGAYLETDAPNPQSTYAQTKLAGEAAVLRENVGAIVARVNFYGWSANGRRSLAEFFVRNLQAGVSVRGFSDVYFCPMFAVDLADAFFRMLQAGLRGLFHVVSPQAMSKLEFGLALANRFGLDSSLISAASVDDFGLAARRSHNLNLSVHKVSTALGVSLPAFSTGLDSFYAQHQQGYPQALRSFVEQKADEP